MKILMTGGAGYLGSVTVPLLLREGHQVTVVDQFLHGIDSLTGCWNDPGLKVIRGDVRDFDAYRGALEAADVVIPLAAMVGMPACDRNPTLAVQVNTLAIENTVHRLRQDQCIIFPCTNSGYGIGGEVSCSEESPLRPVSTYGRSKVAAETAVLRHPGAISLRFATLFGLSPRMRLDLLVNDLCFQAVNGGHIELYEGAYRRNFLHVKDAANVLTWMVEECHYRSRMVGQIFNVGDSAANMTKAALCRLIQAEVPELSIESVDGNDPDQRDYIVSNAKLEGHGWHPRWSLPFGIRELVGAYRAMPYQLAGYRN